MALGANILIYIAYILCNFNFFKYVSNQPSPSAVPYKKYAANSESKICSQLGVRIMDHGGNAMDAAVAVTICIGITNPFSSGIGGGGFLMVRKLNNGKDEIDMFDFRETAPQNIDPVYFKTKSGDAKVGGMSIGVPGEILGLYEAHKEYGKLPWKRLFQENIIIARGHPAYPILIEKLKKNKEYILKDKGLSEIYSRNGQLVKENDTIRRINYSKTLEKISEDPLSFYKGEIADQIVKSIKTKGGILSKKDLKMYQVKKRPILATKFNNFQVYTTNLPTSGIFLIQALKILENFDFTKVKHLIDRSNSHVLFHLLIEVYKLVAAKRGNLGDPDFLKNWQMIISDLMSDKYINKLVEKIDLSHVLDRHEYEQECPFCEDHGTTHLNIVDENEMIVQITSTINLEFGSKFMDPDTGILFNNQIDDFYIPDVVNAYNLGPMMGNILEKRKRPFSSAAPVLLVSPNDIIALGAAGGTRIPTSIIGTLVYMFLGSTMEQAISGGRIHDQLVPEVTYVEPLFPMFVLQELQSKGHNVQLSETNTVFTSVQGIHIIKDAKKEKRIFAVSDPRKDGRSAGR